MEVGKISAQARSGIGTGSVRKLRNQGQIPAICYGTGAAPIAVSVDPTALQKALDPIKGRNTLLQMKIEGAGQGAQELSVLLKDTQRDKLTGKLVHADFLRVRMDHPVRVTVPIAITGKAEGVKAGGTLHQVYRSLTVLATPDKIPTKVEIDVTALGMGQAIHVSDLKLEAGITAGLPGGTTLCVVTAPKAEKAEAAAGEGAEGAATPEAAAAAPAGEAKKDDKGKAAAPAKAPAKAAPAKGK
jgi:large subunit ribosomal protein L25